MFSIIIVQTRTRKFLSFSEAEKNSHHFWKMLQGWTKQALLSSWTRWLSSRPACGKKRWKVDELLEFIFWIQAVLLNVVIGSNKKEPIRPIKLRYEHIWSIKLVKVDCEFVSKTVFLMPSKSRITCGKNKQSFFWVITKFSEFDYLFFWVN